MRINFGVSKWSREHPGAPWEERVKEIPDLGSLEPQPLDLKPEFDPVSGLTIRRLELGHVCVYPYGANGQSMSIPAVTYDLTKIKVICEEVHHDLYLIWIAMRNEWIAFTHDIWVEDGASRQDEGEAGPYQPNDDCGRMILLAYGIPEGAIQPEAALKMAPAELQRLAE